MHQNIDKNMKTESGSAPAHFPKLVLLLTAIVFWEVIGQPDVRHVGCWSVNSALSPFGPHRTIYKTKMLFPHCLFVHLKQKLRELKLPVVPSCRSRKSPPPLQRRRKTFFVLNAAVRIFGNIKEPFAVFPTWLLMRSERPARTRLQRLH